MNLLDLVYVPNGLSKKSILHYQQRFMKAFYLRPRIIGNYVGRLISNPYNIINMLKASYGFLGYILSRSS